MKNNFDFNTIKNFDEHILQSIPQYNVLFDSILRISDYFLDDNKIVYDLGCSTGKLLNSLDFKGQKIGIDNSSNLLPESINNIQFIRNDLNEKNIFFPNACLIYSIFTIQFLRKENRLDLLKRIYDGLMLGGAFIWAEKVYSQESMFQFIFTFSYYDYKKQSFSEKEILDKEYDLRRILRPFSSHENLEMLNEVGFKKIHLFYKYFNFESYLCVK